VTLDLIAEEVHLSAKYLSAMFVRETGMTFKDLLQKIRVQQACYMLRSGGLSFAEIADATGFCSQSHFNSVFKKYTGLTPREYRDLQNIDPWISTGDRLLNLLEG
jgi:AraC-like DNA-binding protein